ncbi:molybdate transport repressor ModE-like protein [Rhodobacter aestuarii]|uniref:HTH-type transcriptional regulator CbbR n=1 Tax=Rhodobacter aestuarii TaxID=453582 RepID=A0A1N7JCF7_9RHOB|nr:LysR substrate-binding domain-containing protein [Rhodobacter aestuarii]PTV96940.1 molybdate transport repressor ModE-like protein [Rhodobacter aestuarii]SIS46966.1 ModE molybdate transport repressor domain-containing protein [Rhodobacter aestuarii]
MIRLDSITLKQLRALQAVEKGGSLTAAGHALGLTTPAIHTQIKGLEDAVQVKILQRAADGGGSELTEAGLTLLETARRIEDALSQGGANLAALSRGKAGRVTLGVVSTAKYFAPRLVKALSLSNPDIEVALRVGNRATTIEGLERGAFDIAIMGRPPRRPPVTAEPLGVHPHGLVAPPDHPLAGQGLWLDALFEEVFLAREKGSGTRILMNRWLDRVGEGRAYETLEMDSNETIKQAVMAGLGIAFLSLHTVTEELASGRLVELPAPALPIVRHWFMVRREDEVPRPVAVQLWNAIGALKGNYLPIVPGN